MAQSNESLPSRTIMAFRHRGDEWDGYADLIVAAYADGNLRTMEEHEERRVTGKPREVLPLDYTQLTWQERRSLREQYVRAQDSKCFYCKVSLRERPPKKIRNTPIDWLLFPENFLRYPIHLQHDHKTGMTEGAVHAYCNAFMWQHEGR